MKIVSLLTALTLALAACGGGGSDEDTTPEVVVQELTPASCLEALDELIEQRANLIAVAEASAQYLGSYDDVTGPLNVNDVDSILGTLIGVVGASDLLKTQFADAGADFSITATDAEATCRASAE